MKLDQNNLNNSLNQFEIIIIWMRGNFNLVGYIGLIFWLIRVSIIVFILIPGTLPILFGYILTKIYQLFDPDLIILQTILQYYKTTLYWIPFEIQISLGLSLVTFLILKWLQAIRIDNPDKQLDELIKLKLTEKYNRYLRYKHNN